MKTTTRFLTALPLALLSAIDASNSAVLAQPFVEWERTVGGGDFELGLAIDSTLDGGFVIAGSTSSFGRGGNDLLAAKLTADGSLDAQWLENPVILGWETYERANAARKTRDGGYLVAGTTTFFGDRDVYIARLDSDGQLSASWLQNPRLVGGGGTEFVAGLVETSDSGCVIGGGTSSFGAGSMDFLAFKLDSEGNLDPSWPVNPRAIGTGEHERRYGLCETADGGLVIVGASRSRAYLVRLDALGQLNPIWPTNPLDFREGRVTMATDVVETEDGGFVVVGLTQESSEVRADVLVFKLDLEGYLDSDWVENPRFFGRSGSDIGRAVERTPDGGVVVAAESANPRTVGPDFYLIKLNSEGNLDPGWFENPLTLPSFGWDYAQDVAVLPNGDFAVVGTTRTFGGGEQDVYVVKLNYDPRRFVRGDADASGRIDLADAMAVLEWLFLGASEPACLVAADADASGDVRLSDAVRVLQWLFAQGEALPEPTPRSVDYAAEDCGTDETLRGDARLDCVGVSPTCS